MTLWTCQAGWGSPYTTNEASSRVTSPVMDMLALFMATLPAQPVGTANEAVVPLGIVPGWIGPPTGVGLPALLAWAVVISYPITGVSFLNHNRMASCEAWTDGTLTVCIDNLNCQMLRRVLHPLVEVPSHLSNLRCFSGPRAINNIVHDGRRGQGPS